MSSWNHDSGRKASPNPEEGATDREPCSSSSPALPSSSTAADDDAGRFNLNSELMEALGIVQNVDSGLASQGASNFSNTQLLQLAPRFPITPLATRSRMNSSTIQVLQQQGLQQLDQQAQQQQINRHLLQPNQPMQDGEAFHDRNTSSLNSTFQQSQQQQQQKPQNQPQSVNLKSLGENPDGNFVSTAARELAQQPGGENSSSSYHEPLMQQQEQQEQRQQHSWSSRVIHASQYVYALPQQKQQLSQPSTPPAAKQQDQHQQQEQKPPQQLKHKHQHFQHANTPQDQRNETHNETGILSSLSAPPFTSENNLVTQNDKTTSYINNEEEKTFENNIIISNKKSSNDTNHNVIADNNDGTRHVSEEDMDPFMALLNAHLSPQKPVQSSNHFNPASGTWRDLSKNIQFPSDDITVDIGAEDLSVNSAPLVLDGGNKKAAHDTGFKSIVNLNATNTAATENGNMANDSNNNSSQNSLNIISSSNSGLETLSPNGSGPPPQQYKAVNNIWGIRKKIHQLRASFLAKIKSKLRRKPKSGNLHAPASKRSNIFCLTFSTFIVLALLVFVNVSLNMSMSNFESQNSSMFVKALAKRHTIQCTLADSKPLTEPRKKPVALAAYPRTGIVWVRAMIERVSGFTTSSMICENLFKTKGFKHECESPYTALAVRTFIPIINGTVQESKKPETIQMYENAVVVIRNPFDVIYLAYLASLDQSQPTDVTTIPMEIVVKEAFRYGNYFKFWQDVPIPKLFIRYEDLRIRPLSTWGRLAYYLGVIVSDRRIECAKIVDDSNQDISVVEKLRPYEGRQYFSPESRSFLGKFLEDILCANEYDSVIPELECPEKWDRINDKNRLKAEEIEEERKEEAEDLIDGKQRLFS